MQKIVSFKYKNRKVKFNVEKPGTLGKIFGLMFTRRESADILLFEFEKPVLLKIHSFFVFFSFICIWLDSHGRVIQVKQVSPFTVAVKPKKPFNKLIEVPINKKYVKILKALR